uniref:Microtubule associated scaffold protein 1 n=1 Tax=Hypotaenidia okinawae TaxID=2861861 RepID=A0A6G1S2S6_9GRUI
MCCQLMKWMGRGTISKPEVINLLLHTCFGSVDDKCSCAVIDSESLCMCVYWLAFRAAAFQKEFSCLNTVVKNMQKSSVAELKSAHESERKSLEDSFKEKQELLEVS